MVRRVWQVVTVCQHTHLRRTAAADLAGFESVGELIGFGAVLDLLDKVVAGEAPLAAHAGSRYAAVSREFVYGGERQG